MTFYHCTAHLYAEDGLTSIGTLDNARNITFQVGVNEPGSGGFEVPLEDASTADIADGKIVKLALYQDASVIGTFAFRVQGESMEFATDGRRWVKFEAPGALSLLSDAVIFPEYGYDGDGIEKRVTAPDRAAGYMSAAGGAWFISADWVAPPTPRTWGTGARGKTPPEFKAFDDTAQWISYWDPDVTQTGTALTYGRSHFTASDPMDVRIMYAFDDFADLYVAGQQLVTADRTQHNQWVSAQTVDVRVSAGEHVVAYLNSNAPYVTGHDNPVAAIMSIRQLDAKGNPVGAPLLNTNATDWLVHDGSTEPDYRKAQLLLRFFAEAADRGVAGITTLNHGWDDTDDSNGDPWTDLSAFTFPIATVSLLDVFTQLCEQGMDMAFDAATMTLKLYKRLGSDLSGSVALTPGDVGGNLMSYVLTSAPVGFTSILAQLSTGVWVVNSDSSAVTAHGLIESGVSLGSVDTASSAAEVAGKLLNESANPLATATAVTSLQTGPVPFVDYNLGDSIHVPGRRNAGAMKARVMRLTVDATGDIVKVTTELVEDLS